MRRRPALVRATSPASPTPFANLSTAARRQLFIAIGATLLYSNAAAQSCFGSYSDQFSSNTIGPSRFYVFAASCGTIAQTGGELVLSSPAGCIGAGSVSTKSTLPVCGDFDVQVDYHLVGFTPPEVATEARVARLVVFDTGHTVALAVIE